MQVLDWNPAWETGIARLDHEHQLLFRNADTLIEAISNRKAQDELVKSINNVNQCVDRCFSCEEFIMALANYPDFASHCTVHNRLCQKIAQINKCVSCDLNALSEALANFVDELIVAHVEDEDRELARYLHDWTKAQPMPDLDFALGVFSS